MFQKGKSVHPDTSRWIGSPKLRRAYIVSAVGTTVQHSPRHEYLCRLPLEPLAVVPAPSIGFAMQVVRRDALRVQ